MQLSELASIPYSCLTNTMLVFIACEKGVEEAVALLIRFGATTTKACAQGGTPLHEAVSHKNLTMCKMLLQAGAKLTARNTYGIDPLFTAAQCGYHELLSFLLTKGRYNR